VGRGVGRGGQSSAADLAAGTRPSVGSGVNGGSSCSGEGAGSSGGVRFACAQLAFIRGDELESFGADDCLAGWHDRVVHGV
jgi:hypothetical protein